MPFINDNNYAPASVQSANNFGNTSDTNINRQGKVSFGGREPYWDLNEIVLDQETKNALQDAIVFCQQREKIANEWNLKKFLKGSGGCTGINMYGKPGTGKSIAAEAIAKAINKKIIKVDYSEIQNEKWGGTESKLTELFTSAKENDSIIFFDEADSILGKRHSDGANSETNNQIKAHLLTLLDDYPVIVIFATNLFENYDRAFFRRILFHINFPLPNKEQLINLWKFHLGRNEETNIVPRSSDFSFEKLAEESHGLSGGDIKNLTLKICIHIVACNLSEITNNIVSKEISRYKKSLSDMDPKYALEANGQKLVGKDAEIAKELINNTNNN